MSSSAAGMVLDSEAEKFNRRIEGLAKEFPNAGGLSRVFLEQAVVLSIRMDRIANYESAVMSERVRAAQLDFDARRLDAIARQVDSIDHDPVAAGRRLQESPEGLDWLIAHWVAIQRYLLEAPPSAWTFARRSRLEGLLGHYEGYFQVSRVFALFEAMLGHSHYLDPRDGPGLKGDDRAGWAREELGRLIGVEVVRLREVRARFDTSSIAFERARVADRAMLDHPASVRIALGLEQQYELDFHRCLRMLAKLASRSS